MDIWKLWHVFESSGRVEDYLRYRGVDIPAATASIEKEESAYGDRTKTASDDRRADSSGI